MSTIKRIDPKEFQEIGYLQELNRQFLHPLGMGLEVIIDDEADTVSIGGIWDLRDDPEGMIFGDGEIDQEKVARVQAQWQEKEMVRLERFGYTIQPTTSEKDK